MLPDISLDNDQFKDIMEDARNMIVTLYPEWTDFNYHDPGITLLEMFAWIKESQQYYIDRIGDRHYEKYLKLLCMERKHKQPARSAVMIGAAGNLTVLAGTKFYSGDVCFEAETTEFIPSEKIALCICAGGGGSVRIIDRGQLDFGGSLRMYPFGKQPKEGECFYIGFENSMEVDTAFNIWFSVYDGYPVKRNPFSETEPFIPLAEISAEICTGSGWTKAELIRDDTHAFLTSGYIRLKLPFEIKKCEVSGKSLYFLRFRLVRQEYDVPPMFNSVTLQRIDVVQKDTRSECFDFPANATGIYTVSTGLSVTGKSRVFLISEDGSCEGLNLYRKRLNEETGDIDYEIGTPPGVCSVRIVNTAAEDYDTCGIGFGTGLPFQEYDLEDSHILYDDFGIMSRIPGEGNRYQIWKKVRDFSKSGPSDAHYIFDSDSGKVRFGDCRKGLAPEGQIFYISRSDSFGRNGNVTAEKITTIDKIKLDGVAITNPENASGGADEETAEQCFLRTRRMLSDTLTTVTYADYEKAAMETPGLMIDGCHVIPADVRFRPSGTPQDLTVSLVIKPYAQEHRKNLGEAFTRNVRQYLEPRRMMGTCLNIIAAEYVEISVYADISVKPHYRDFRKMIETAVSDFFQNYSDDFGIEIPYSKLYGVLDMLECVESVNSLSMETTGTGITRTNDGNIQLSPNGCAVLGRTEYLFSSD